MFIGEDNIQNISETDSVFGLTEAQLLPIVENIAGEPVASFHANVRHQVGGEHYGYSAEKVISAFIYTTRSGRKGNASVFAKRFNEAIPDRESFHYAALAKLGAPIPLMYGSINASQPDQKEIIFLEYLDPVPDYRPYNQFVKHDRNFIQFLKVTAHFDALRPYDDYAAKLRTWSPHELYGESIEHCIARFNWLWGDAQSWKLGDSLARVCTDGAFDRLYRLMERLVNIEFPPPTCICHDCYEPCHTGWRRKTGEMLIFDLQGITLGPRFANISIWLGAPDDLQPRCRPRRKLAETYLMEYSRRGGGPMSTDQFLAETRNQWLCEAVCLADRWRKNILEGQTVYQDLLFRLIRCLLREAS